MRSLSGSMHCGWFEWEFEGAAPAIVGRCGLLHYEKERAGNWRAEKGGGGKEVALVFLGGSRECAAKVPCLLAS